MNITLRQLDAFLAVTRTLSFSKAADLVHLSQPALSANIRRLEETIGARLFDRDTRTVALSPIGIEFAAVAASLMENVDSGLAHIQRFVSGERGTLALAVAPSLAGSFLPAAIAAFRKERPGVELTLYDVLADNAVEMVRNRSVDLALTAWRDDADDLVQQEVMIDDLVVLCSASHPLASKRSIDWDDLRNTGHIAKKGGSGVRHIIDEAYLQRGEVFRPAFEVDNVGTMLGLILAGLGCGVFPRSSTVSFNLNGLAVKPFTRAVRPRRRICTVTLRGRSLNASTAHFSELCRKHADRHSRRR
ncbi:LysR family transcriptional regulator [Pigmentiphaga daeguensis]|uniref:LysR family transcriptional regulator n=2 Tax=Pigmentiphaga daeguensis TaxID=414049 RepID=A0ABP3MV71_9BURK